MPGHPQAQRDHVSAELTARDVALEGLEDASLHQYTEIRNLKINMSILNCLIDGRTDWPWLMERGMGQLCMAHRTTGWRRTTKVPSPPKVFQELTRSTIAFARAYYDLSDAARVCTISTDSGGVKSNERMSIVNSGLKANPDT